MAVLLATGEVFSIVARTRVEDAVSLKTKVKLAARKIVEETLEAEVAEAVKRDYYDNGYCESFNGKLRVECLNIEQWQVPFNTRRPHSSLGYRLPAPKVCHPVIFTNATPQSLGVM